MNIPTTLKRKIRHMVLGYDISTYYFAQGGEDAILYSIFRKKLNRKEKGFFVDVGAYHPYKHSNTYFFYINGWTGINIDASPGSMKLFNKVRNKDTNLEIGVGEKKGTLTFYVVGEKSTMNSFSKENLVANGMYQYVKKEVPVKVDTLENILDDHAVSINHFDLLCIDAEGLDFEILKSNNWDKYRPDCIVVELDCKDIEDINNNESAQFLSKLGYKIVAKNIILKDLASVFFVLNSFQY